MFNPYIAILIIAAWYNHCYIASYTISFITVNFCCNINITNHDRIEFISFAHIDSLVGVEKILEGYNLSLQVRIMNVQECALYK